ncbi:hypothetical protein [Luteolibacter sp. Populi]|uniref:hypothetical protein n=1 Tax=Luteolibacter sp. Populi TaxID=3230487 RepID=UPI0034652D58
MVSALDLDADKQAFVDAVMLPLGDDVERREILEECLAVAETLPRVPKGDFIGAATRRMHATAASFKLCRRAGLVVALAAILAAGWWAVAGLPALRSWERVYVANQMSGSMGSMCCEHGNIPTFPRLAKRAEVFEDDPGMRRFLSGIGEDRRLHLIGGRAKDRMPRDGRRSGTGILMIPGIISLMPRATTRSIKNGSRIWWQRERSSIPATAGSG